MKNLLAKLFCIHAWEEKKHFVIPSRADNVKELGYTPTTWDTPKRQYVTDYVCLKCGRLKRFVEKTY